MHTHNRKYSSNVDLFLGEMWSLAAHSKEVTGLAASGQCEGFLSTTSTDGSLKVWDFKDKELPTLVHERDFKMGVVHCLELCPDYPFIVASGGDNKSHNFTVLNLLGVDVGKCKLILVLTRFKAICNKISY